jgi:hypothetical protein
MAPVKDCKFPPVPVDPVGTGAAAEVGSATGAATEDSTGSGAYVGTTGAALEAEGAG